MPIIEYTLDNEEKIAFEVKSTSSTIPVGTANDTVIKASQTFNEALERIAPSVRMLRQHLSELRADEVEVEFGLKVSAEAGLIVASATIDANYTVKLKWSNKESDKQ